ncbi:MAG: TonB-dependent receptor plug domain-containing protein [Cytophagaceae bacterium]|nr:TonB-dependent receptor plug domain-containing protein [Cytophagaceae bacterium]
MGNAFRKVIFSGLLAAPFFVFAQTDSTKNLKELVVKGYDSNVSVVKTPSSVSTLKLKDIQRFDNAGPVVLLNTQAGVRIEERSPGSYRIALRGSSLRSPFNVRNVKVYYNDIPITDGNGITYFNQIDFNNIGSVEILKGPSGSIYGAGIGGVISLSTKDAAAGKRINIASNFGSYGLYNQNLSFESGSKKTNTFLGLNYSKYDGYRTNSAMNRLSLNFSNTFFLNPKHQVSTFAYLSDLEYRTPGGLTLAQKDQNPKAARPATATLPGAEAQKAGILQKIGFAGIADQYNFGNGFTLKSAISFSINHLQNPFITSFEDRNEHSLGGRITLTKTFTEIPLRLWLGDEIMSTRSSFEMNENIGGVKGKYNYTDKIKSLQNSTYFQFEYQLPLDFMVSGGLSLNQQKYNYQKTTATQTSNVILENPKLPVAPRISLLKSFGESYSVFATLAGGFSAPTGLEVVSSIQNSAVYNGLLAENGLNKEIGIKHFSNTAIWNFELSLFDQIIKNGLVRKLTEAGNEYFVNTGKIGQQGLEFSNTFSIIKPDNKLFVKNLQLKSSLTLFDFKYLENISETQDLSGKAIPGVAKTNIYSGLDLDFIPGIFIKFDYYYLSKIPLNDLNSVFSTPLHLGNSRIGYEKSFSKISVKIYGGIENIFNEKYSAGYDFNAVGNRYFNPSPPRNYNLGLSISRRFN